MCDIGHAAVFREVHLEWRLRLGYPAPPSLPLASAATARLDESVEQIKVVSFIARIANRGSATRLTTYAGHVTFKNPLRTIDSVRFPSLPFSEIFIASVLISCVS